MEAEDFSFFQDSRVAPPPVHTGSQFLPQVRSHVNPTAPVDGLRLPPRVTTQPQEFRFNNPMGSTANITPDRSVRSEISAGDACGDEELIFGVPKKFIIIAVLVLLCFVGLMWLKKRLRNKQKSKAVDVPVNSMRNQNQNQNQNDENNTQAKINSLPKKTVPPPRPVSAQRKPTIQKVASKLPPPPRKGSPPKKPTILKRNNNQGILTGKELKPPPRLEPTNQNRNPPSIPEEEGLDDDFTTLQELRE